MTTSTTRLSRLPRLVLLVAAGLVAALLTGCVSSSEARIDFTEETLPNGLRVIYAPLHQAPVAHVRLLYHVGSRDERPDRQGFAHMFEHMMFRGSAHVKAEEHMKLIHGVGGACNAFTSFDQTVYYNTVPANQLELALYLEADRMASFRVSDAIYQTERNVVSEEWRMRQNRPYGTMWEDFARLAYTTHSYRWTPIGNMAHLRAAEAIELQEFFDRYYVPNNAVLVVAGDFDAAQARALVRRSFAWVPRGPEVKRDIPQEPEPKEPRRAEVRYRVPLVRLMIGYHLPAYRHEDHAALELLATILGGGRSARLDRQLVHGDKPSCVDVGAGHMNLEDSGAFTLSATVLAGRDPAEVEKALLDAVVKVRQNGVTAEELAKAKAQARIGLIRSRETAMGLASQLGQEALFGGDPGRVNTELERLMAVTPDQVQAAANRYLLPHRATAMKVVPDPAAPTAQPLEPAPAKEPRPVPAQQAKFPGDYPAQPPVNRAPPKASFAKGTELDVNGVKVIVMSDHRLPLVNWSLVMRRGSDSDPAPRSGLASMCATMVRRGVAGMSFAQLNEDLESRGVSVEVGAGGDNTRLSGSCTTDQLDHAFRISRLVLHKPMFPADEFAKRQEQWINQLKLGQENPSSVAGDELAEALYGSSPLGVRTTPASVGAITLADVKQCYDVFYVPNDAVLVMSGDVTVARGRALAEELLAGWRAATIPPVDYALAVPAAQRRVILVDRPEGQQSTVRLAVRAYDIRSDEKFAGALVNQIMGSGIESRLGRYVRAEKGYAYSVGGAFQPSRHGGHWGGGTDTSLATTADAIEAMFKVIDDMRRSDVTDAELEEAKLRVAGGMLMSMQTIGAQAAMRVDGILNGYPIDYYDRYAQRVAEVTRMQVRQVVERYLDPQRFAVVVVAPAEKVQAQLERLGDVKVLPMPGKR